ncbi:FAD assembly factor SdhE [Pinisolibacter sp.]|uniref:FAD assembly factor SdhE n=1 Tax=Pinisolibacter sp. TaxID=2172024 RepID=UPI002FDE0FDD
MSTTLTTDGLDARRKKALYRSWHRGTKEMDFVMGHFADAHIAGLSDADLDDYETLLDVSDRELFAWIVGTEEVDPIHDRPVWRAMREFTHAEKSV